MKPCVPHYRLFSVADSENRPGYWRFCFCSEDGAVVQDMEDLEPKTRGARLELLTLVRALESLDHPAEITVAGGSRYVREGLRFGISQWKQNDWCWERFGRMIPIRNRDLWQRIDRAAAIHHLSCAPRTNATDYQLNRPGDPPAAALQHPLSVERANVDEGRGKTSRRSRLFTHVSQWGSTISATAQRFASRLRWSIPRLPMPGTRFHCR